MEQRGPPSMAGSDASTDTNTQWHQLQQRISARRLTIQSDPGYGLQASQSLRSLPGRGDAVALGISRVELQRAVADAVEAAEARLLAALQRQIPQTLQPAANGTKTCANAAEATASEALAAAVARAEAAERASEVLRAEVDRLDSRLRCLETVTPPESDVDAAAAAASAAAERLNILEERLDGCAEQMESLERRHTQLVGDLDAAVSGAEASRSSLAERLDSLDVRAGEQMDAFELRLQALEANKDSTPQQEPRCSNGGSAELPAAAVGATGTASVAVVCGVTNGAGSASKSPALPSPGPAVERFSQTLDSLISRLGAADGVGGTPTTARPASALGSPHVTHRCAEPEVGSASISAVAGRLAALEEAVTKLQTTVSCRSSSGGGVGIVDAAPGQQLLQQESSFDVGAVQQISPSPSLAPASKTTPGGTPGRSTPGRSPSVRTSSAGGAMGSGLAALKQQLDILSRRVDGLQREQQAQAQQASTPVAARTRRISSSGGGAGVSSLSGHKPAPSPAAERLGQRIQALSDETGSRIESLVADVASLRAACESSRAASDNAASKAESAAGASKMLKDELASVEARVSSLENTLLEARGPVAATPTAAGHAARPSLLAPANGPPSCGASTGGVPCRPLFSPAAQPSSGSRPARSSMDGGLDSPSFALHRVGALPYPSAALALAGAVDLRGEGAMAGVSPHCQREFHNGLYGQEASAADSGCTHAHAAARSASAAGSAAASAQAPTGVARRIAAAEAGSGEDEAESRPAAQGVPPSMDVAASVRALQVSSLKPSSVAAAAAAAMASPLGGGGSPSPLSGRYPHLRVKTSSASKGGDGISSPGRMGLISALRSNGVGSTDGDAGAVEVNLSPAALQLRPAPQQVGRGENWELDAAKEELARAAQDSPGRVRRQALAIETVVAVLTDCGVASPTTATCDGRPGHSSKPSSPSPRRGRGSVVGAYSSGPRSPLRASGGARSPVGPRVPSPLLGLIKLEGSEAWSDDLISGPGPDGGARGAVGNGCSALAGEAPRSVRSLLSDETPAPPELLSPVLRLRGGARLRGGTPSDHSEEWWEAEEVGQQEQPDHADGGPVAIGSEDLAEDESGSSLSGSLPVAKVVVGSSGGNKPPPPPAVVPMPQPVLLKPGARAFVPLAATAGCGVTGSGLQQAQTLPTQHYHQQQEKMEADVVSTGVHPTSLLAQRLQRLSSGGGAARWQPSSGGGASDSLGGVVYAPLRRRSSATPQ